MRAEERAHVHTCLCARPSFRGRGKNHRLIDFFQTNYHCFDARRWYTHLPARSSFSPARMQAETCTTGMPGQPICLIYRIRVGKYTCPNLDPETLPVFTHACLKDPHLNITVLLLNPGCDFKRIQVLVERNEGFQGSAGVDGCSSDHSRQNLHVHDGAVKEWSKKWHLDVQENVKTLKREPPRDIKLMETFGAVRF